MSEEFQGTEVIKLEEKPVFKTKICKTVDALLDSNSFQLKDGVHVFDSIKLNTDVVVDTLENIKQEAFPPLQEEVVISSSEIKAAFSDTLRGFLSHDIISGNVMGQVSRIIKPSGVTPSENANASFLYLDDNFPEDPERRGEILLGKRAYAKWEGEFKSIYEKVGLNLTDEQIRQTTLRFLISHEYGHAVERGIAILKSEDEMTDSEKLNPMSGRMKIMHGLKMHVYEQLAPNSKLQSLFTEEKVASIYRANDPALTTSERIATGFERLGLQYALEDINVDPIQIDQVLNYLQQTHESRFTEQKYILDKAKKKGFSLEQLSAAIDLIDGEMHKMERKDLAELTRGGFSGHTFGYAFPLNQDQIKEFTKEANVN